MEGLIFGGAYVRREICVSKSIGLACSGKEIYHFCFVCFVFEGKFLVQAPGGAYIQRGDLTEGFLRSTSLLYKILLTSAVIARVLNKNAV